MPQPFNNAAITNDGARFLTEAQAGQQEIIFTRIATGNGAYSEDEKTPISLQGQSNLKSLRNSFPISNIEVVSERAVKVTVLITNQDPITKEAIVNEGYYINEIGLYAKPADAEDGEEVLYSIAVTSAENGDFMPPYNGYNPVQITQDYFVTVNNTSEVTIQTNAGAVALVEDLEALKKEVQTNLEEMGEKLSGIEEGANKTVVDSELSEESENPVQNKVVDAALKSLGAAVIISDTAPDRTENVLWVKPGGST